MGIKGNYRKKKEIIGKKRLSSNLLYIPLKFIKGIYRRLTEIKGSNKTSSPLFSFKFLYIPLKSFKFLTSRKVIASLLLIVFLTGGILRLLPPPEVFSATWPGIMNSYQRRKQLNIVNNSGATLSSGTTFQVTVDTSALSPKPMASCDDIRIVYQTSDTVATELSRHTIIAQGASGCHDSKATIISFPLQAQLTDAGTSTSYYLYWGNHGATSYASSTAVGAYSVTNGTATFAVPFNNLTTAMAAGSGTPTTATGAIRYSGGKSALSFDGVNDKVVTTNFNSSTNKLTVEAWINPNLITNASIINKFKTAGYPWDLAQYGRKIYFHLSAGANYGNTTSNVLTANVWYHVAAVYDGSGSTNSDKVKIYINGVSQSLSFNGTIPSTLNDTTDTVDLGYSPSDGYSYYSGLIDEVRVSDSIRYSSNFTPSTSPFVRDSNTKLLLHFDENGNDPRVVNTAFDDSGNGNHGTITGAVYTGGLVGVDPSASSGQVASQSYAGHQGIFIEEGTTNQITNPSFENSTYNTNWTASDGTENYNSAADTFTASMSKRNSAGPFAAGPIAQGDWLAGNSGTHDDLNFSAGSQISGNFYQNFDATQGSVVLWFTPEWDGNDGKNHAIFQVGGSAIRFYAAGSTNQLCFSGNTGTDACTSIAAWTAGSTHLLVGRWDQQNPIKASTGEYVSLTVDDVSVFADTTAGTAAAPTTGYVGWSGADAATRPANGIIEGLTIYRRPLFDGANGINAGNGDEIRLINGGGSHSGANNASTLTDANKAWTASILIGGTIVNETDGSSGTITANTSTTVTATLSGGTDHDWDTGDIYSITNIGTGGVDPTLITGSWDVVFDMPTNSTAGALATGTGEAWSHPHSSNLVGNTGTAHPEYGFMMNGTYTNDGWAATDSQWYLAGGIDKTNAVAAYKGKGAASAAASYNNQAVPGNGSADGTNDLTSVGDPTFDTATGWTFATWKYLRTGVIPAAGSLFVGFSDSTGNGTPIGSYNTGYFYVSPIASDNYRVYKYGTGTLTKPSGSNISSGIMGFADTTAYLNGSSDGTISAGWDGSAPEIYIGCANNNGSPVGWFPGKVQAASIYNSTLTPAQALAVSNAIANLGGATVAALDTSEKIFPGGYKVTSTAAMQGISNSISVTAGNDYVVRAVVNSDETSIPRLLITKADGTTEITHVDGTSTSTRTAPDILLLTFEAPATENIQVQLINTDGTSGDVTYWHQVEVLPNYLDNPSFASGSSSGGVWTPTGWTNNGLDSGEGVQETSDCHSGSSCFKETGATGNEGIFTAETSNITTGKFVSQGGFFKSAEGQPYIWDQLDDNYHQATTNSRFILNITSTSWSHLKGIYRQADAGIESRAYFVTNHFTANQTCYFDDAYMFPLTDVSLTVTPANEANSGESSGLRVDGRDILYQTITGLDKKGGEISFKYTPRHSASVIGNFGFPTGSPSFSTPNVFDMQADASNYLHLIYESTTSLLLQGNFNGTLVSARWNSSLTLNAGTTYTIKVKYAAGGTLSLLVDDVQKATGDVNVPSSGFAAVPTTIFFGTNVNYGVPAEGTFSAATVTSVTPAANTTAPYYKFGSKSTKLDGSSADATNYLTSINVGSTATQTLSAYVYNGTSGSVGGTVDGTVATLVFKGSSVSTTYTDMGGGWWRLTYSGAGVNAASNYGVHVQTGKIVYVDGVQLEALAFPTTYTDGGLGTGYGWDSDCTGASADGAGTANNSCSIRTATSIQYSATNNISATAGSISLWYKPSHNNDGSTYQGLFNAGGNNMIDAFYYIPGNYIRFGNNNQLACYLAANQKDNWIHVVATWTGTTRTIYCNNAKTSYNDVTAPTIGANLLISSVTGTGKANGTISDFRVFSSAISDTQVTDLYNEGRVSYQNVGSGVQSVFGDGEPPVAAWKMDEGTGTTTYDSAPNPYGGNNGTISGATWATEDMCLNGKCLKFDGSDDNVTSSNNSALNFTDSNFSASFWIKPTSIDNNDVIISRGLYTTDGWYVNFATDGSGTRNIMFVTNQSGARQWVRGSTSLDLNKWYHVEITRSGSTGSIYINGKEESSYIWRESLINPATSSRNLYLMRYDSAGNETNGYLDEVRIFNYARTATQAKADYNTRGNLKGSSAVLSANIQNQATGNPLSNGLVGYWKMDESSWGTVVDSSGNGNNGTASGATVTTGKFGNAGSFDGTDDYVDAGSATALDNLPNNNMTISGWMNRQAQNGNYPSLINKGWYVRLAGGVNPSVIDFVVPFSGGNTRAYTVAGTTAAVWTHWAVVWNASTKNIDIYIDGTLANSVKTTGSGTYTSDANTNLQFGVPASSLIYYKGLEDELRIYNRALSPQEVRQLYEWAPEPVAYYKLDEGTGTSAANSSSASFTGTLTNGPTWTQGKYGKAVNFDGSNDFIDVGTGPTIANTISFWVNPASTTEYFVDLNGSAYVWANAGTVTATGFTSPTIYVNGVVTSTIATNVWSHVEVTTATALNASDLDIGRLEGTSNLEGKIDEVKIYDYARTIKQVTEDMLGGHPPVNAGSGTVGGVKTVKLAAPVAYYKFDEGYLTTANNSGSAGNVINGAISGATWTNSGKFGKALVFDGLNDYIQAPDDNSLDITNLTLSAWINPGILNGRIIDKETSGGSNGYIMDTFNSKIRLCASGCVSSNTTLSTGVWHHIVVTFDGTNTRFYLDGKSDGSSTTVTSVSTNALNLRIGADQDGANVFNGSIDEVKIYNYALSEDEVKIDYNHGSALVLGARGDNTTYEKQATNQAYCVPGDTTSCAAPVAEWNFDEGFNQSANDISGNGNTGTLGSAATPDSADPIWTSGKYGKALKFDGTDDVVSINDIDSIDFAVNQNFTIEFWVKAGLNDVNDEPLSKYGASAYPYLFRNMTGNYLRFIRYDGTNGPGITSTIATSDNQWHHITGVKNGSLLYIYVDGKSAATPVTDTTTGTTTNTSNLRIGGRPTGGNNYQGSIDNVLIFNYARTASQIAYDYNRGEPVAHYKFDECQGATAYDSSANQNNGTITIGTGVGSTQSSVGTCTDGLSTSARYNGASGKYNYSLNFDGMDDFVSVSNSLSTNSVAFWVKPTSTTASMINLTTTQYISADSGAISAANFTSPTYYVNGVSTATPTLTANVWNHIVVTTATAITANAITIGKANNAYTNGQFDDVRIYNYALTTTQVKNLYNDGAVNFK